MVHDASVIAAIVVIGVLTLIAVVMAKLVRM